MSSQINTLESLLSTARALELFLARSLEFKEASVEALEIVLARARESAAAVSAELAQKRQMITETEAALAAARAPSVPAPVKGARILWKTHSFTVASEEAIRQITTKIDSGALFCKKKSFTWARGKHHPSDSAPSKIISALRSSGGRASFAALEAAVALPTKGEHILQNYLRELHDQGIVSLA
jgi:hypothetical protein